MKLEILAARGRNRAGLQTRFRVILEESRLGSGATTDRARDGTISGHTVLTTCGRQCRASLASPHISLMQSPNCPTYGRLC